jgi:hypothetical protein
MARVPHIIVAGLDFGTSYTKCIVRNLAFPDQAYVVPFSHNGRKECWVPSIVYRHKDGSHQTSLQTSSLEAEQVPYIKMRLLGLMDEQALDWRPTGAEADKWFLHQAESDAAFYLSHILWDVANFIHTTWSDFGNDSQDQVLVNICIPVHHADKPDVEIRFKVALVRAYLATDFINPSQSRPNREVVSAISINSQEFRSAFNRCNTYPETSANLQAFLKSPSRQNGLFIMADVGGGTVDVSIFEYDDRASTYPLTYYHNEVICAGSSQHEIRMAKSLRDRGLEDMPIRQLTAWKERRVVPDGLERDDLEQLLDDVRQKIRDEVGVAVGTCVGETMQAFNTNVKLAKERVLQTGRFFFAGGGFTENPYELGARFFETTWAAGAAETGNKVPSRLKALRIPFPTGLEFPDIEGITKAKEVVMFNRLTVAYGLSFAIESLDEQRFPSSVPKTPNLPFSEVAKVYAEDTVDT